MNLKGLKYHVLFFLLGVLFIARPSLGQKLVPVTITIDESNIIREIPEELFGFNHNWIFSEQRVWNNERNQVSDDFVDLLSGFPLPLNRMAGAESQFFHWKYAIGSIDRRIEQELVPRGKKDKRVFGPIEWAKSTLAVDHDAKFSWVFNMENETPADHADLVEFLVGDGKNNINGGVNWAGKRIQLGLPEPVNVSIWELGNELDFKNGARDWPLERYINESKQIITAVRAVDPDAKIAAHAASAPWVKKRYIGRDWREWHRKVLEEIGTQIDFISFHPYYLGVATSEIDKFLDEIQNDILRITGQNRIKIFISEHAVWPSKAILSGRGSDNWYQTHSLAGVLGTAQFLNRLIARKEVEAATYHCFSGGPWGIFYKNEASGGLYTTGLFDLFRLFSIVAGKEVVQASVTGKDTDVQSGSLKFTASAAKVSGGLIVLVVNRDGNVSRNATFRLNKKYRLVKVLSIVGGALDSYDDGNGENIYLTSKNVSNNYVFNRFKFYPKTACILFLKMV